MKKKLILIVLIVFCHNSIHSQKSTFHKGYYIDYSNKKIEGLIKNEDWDYNPTEFKYKADINSETQNISMSDFQEFGVDEYKFVKTNVKIDKSPDSYTEANKVKAMSFVNELLVIRVLLEGNASLYSYKNENYLRFFYRTNGQITPLSYKLYFNDIEKGYTKNENYKQELVNALKCDKISQSDFDNLQYTVYELEPLFIKYNNCMGGTVVEYKAKKNFNTFEVFGKAGVTMSSFKFNDAFERDFGNKTKVKFGFELEVNLSNKAKTWSILIEPTYQYYKGTYDGKNAPSGFSNADVDADYKAIDLSLGIRKYLMLSEKADFFINLYATYGAPLGSGKVGSFDISKTVSPALGIGFLYNKKYSLEVRYEFTRDLLSSYVAVGSEYKSVGLAFGYKLL